MTDAAPDALGVLDRITAVFEAFDGDDRGLGISELALRAGLPKSTVSRIVAGLVRQRYLERDGALIHLGLRLFELGQLAEMPQELRIAALPVMAELRNATGESVQLAIRDGAEMMCIAVMRARAPAPSASRIGERAPLHATALGKVLLAHSPANEIEKILPGMPTEWAPDATAELGRLKRELAEIQRTGVALESVESGHDIAGVASPVVFPSWGAIAALGLRGPTERFDPARAASAVREAAHSVECRLSANRGR
ncbi:IclR family transcriptional regulator [Micromonospora sp. DT81.3]|uniref:IclR family transcriptional regulator n=1 Tax=Micromonospora sp. DT81.3 TaxID=3416523 RepID=UPI003CF823CA